MWLLLLFLQASDGGRLPGDDQIGVLFPALGVIFGLGQLDPQLRLDDLLVDQLGLQLGHRTLLSPHCLELLLRSVQLHAQ